MSKVKNVLRKTSRKLFTKRVLKVALLLLLGVVIGLSGGYLLWHKNKTSISTVPRSAPLSPQELNKQREQLSQDQYTRAKEMVKADLKNKRITQGQADTINAKLDEMKAFLAKTDRTSKEGRDKIRAKREELRKWAQENNISIKYTLLIY